MTTDMTGIFIRKAILSQGLRPSDFDEQAIFNACEANSIDQWEFDQINLEDYRVRN